MMLAYLALSVAPTQIISEARQKAQIALESTCMWRYVFLGSEMTSIKPTTSNRLDLLQVYKTIADIEEWRCLSLPPTAIPMPVSITLPKVDANYQHFPCFSFDACALFELRFFSCITLSEI